MRIPGFRRWRLLNCHAKRVNKGLFTSQACIILVWEINEMKIVLLKSLYLFSIKDHHIRNYRIRTGKNRGLVERIFVRDIAFSRGNSDTSMKARGWKEWDRPKIRPWTVKCYNTLSWLLLFLKVIVIQVWKQGTEKNEMDQKLGHGSCNVITP